MPTEVLENYYDVVARKKLELLPNFFALPTTLIGLYGYRPILDAAGLVNTYQQLLDEWESQGISPEIGHDPSSYNVQKIQENVVFIRNTLTNYDFNGKEIKRWNCSYTIVEADGVWKILCASSDNASSFQKK